MGSESFNGCDSTSDSQLSQFMDTATLLDFNRASQPPELAATEPELKNHGFADDSDFQWFDPESAALVSKNQPFTSQTKPTGELADVELETKASENNSPTPEAASDSAAEKKSVGTVPSPSDATEKPTVESNPVMTKLGEDLEFARFTGNKAAEAKAAEQLYKLTKEKSALDSPQVLAAAVRLGGLQSDTGTDVLATLVAEQRLKLGTDHPAVAKTLNAAGDLMMNKHWKGKEDVAKAIDYYEQALEIEQKQGKVNYKSLDESTHRLVAAYSDSMNNNQATHGWESTEKLIRDSIKNREDLLAKEDLDAKDRPEIAESLARLHMLMAAQYQTLRNDHFDKLANAELMKALAICTKHLPEDHPSTSNLYAIFSNVPGSKSAIEYRIKSIAGREKQLGPDDPSVGIGYGIRAEMYAAQGQSEKAEADYKRAEAILVKALGPDHKESTDIKASMAKFYAQNKDFKKAEDINLQLLASEIKAYGKPSKEVYERLVKLHYLYDEAGDQKKKKGIDDELSSISAPTGKFFSPPPGSRFELTQAEYEKGTNSKDPAERAWSQYRLADLHAKNKDTDKAATYYRQALKTFAEIDGTTAHMLVDISKDYAKNVLLPQGKEDEAKKLFESAKKIETLHRARKTPHM